MKKVIISACFSFVVIGASIGVGIYFSLSSSQIGLCEKLDLTNKVSPIIQNLCLHSKCTFDFSKCSEDCPFGYDSDANECEISWKCATSRLFEGDIYFEETDVPGMLMDYGYVDDSNVTTSVFSGSLIALKEWKDYNSICSWSSIF